MHHIFAQMCFSLLLKKKEKKGKKFDKFLNFPFATNINAILSEITHLNLADYQISRDMYREYSQTESTMLTVSQN